MNELTFGRYASFDTITHRLDSRTKVLISIFFMVMIFFQFNVWSTCLIISGIFLILVIVLMLISKVNVLNLFKSLLGMWFLILFLMVIYVFVPNPTYTHPIANINGFILYADAFYTAIYIILRLILMIGVTMILTSTTKPFDLTYAFEWYLTPLTLIKFPSHILAMMTSIALRFIPTILDETNRIMKAQESRGVDLTNGKIAKKFKAIISLIIPLFVSCFERSEELANAMEARGYDPKAKRTRYYQLAFHLRDLFAIIIFGALFGFMIYLFAYQRDLDLLALFGIDAGF